MRFLLFIFLLPSLAFGQEITFPPDGSAPPIRTGIPIPVEEFGGTANDGSFFTIGHCVQVGSYTNPGDGFIYKRLISTGAACGGGGGSTTFLDLTDTPSSYAGQALKRVRVNVGETALEFFVEPTPTVTLTVTPTPTVTKTPVLCPTDTTGHLGGVFGVNPDFCKPLLTPTASATVTQTPTPTITATPTVTLTPTPWETPFLRKNTNDSHSGDITAVDGVTDSPKHIFQDGSGESCEVYKESSGGTLENLILQCSIDDIEIRDHLYLDNQKSLRLLEQNANGNDYIGFTAPASVTANRNCNLDDDDSPIPDSCVGDGVDASGAGVPATVEPGVVSSSTSGAVGVDTDYAREDHNHDLGTHAHSGATNGGTIAYTDLTGEPTAANAEPPAVSSSTSGTVGTTTTEFALEDHSHDLSTHAHTGATNGGTITTIDAATSADSTSSVAFFESATGNLGPKTDPGFTYDATANVATLMGLESAESDTNPACAAGNYNIFADLSETKWKKCTNGTVTDLDTTGGGGGTPTPTPTSTPKIMYAPAGDNNIVGLAFGTLSSSAMRCTPLVPAYTMTATKIAYRTTTGTSGTCGIAIYEHDGATRITTNGGVAILNSGDRIVKSTVSAFTLEEGRKYRYCYCCSTSISLHAVTAASNADLWLNTYVVDHGTSANNCTSGVPPTTTGTITASAHNVPIMTIAEQ